MKKLEKILIDVPIYSATIDIRLGDIKKLKDIIKKSYKVHLNKNDEVIGQIGGIAFNLEKDYGVGGVFLIAVDNFWNCSLSYGLPIVMHEIIHATNFLIGNRGMSCNENDDEILTYISSYIFDIFLQKIKIDSLQKIENSEDNEKD